MAQNRLACEPALWHESQSKNTIEGPNLQHVNVEIRTHRVKDSGVDGGGPAE